MEDNKKYKVLCLHGYGQNASKFRSQTSALRRCLKKVAEFTYVNGPVTLENSTTTTTYGWSSVDDNEYLHKVWNDQGPFDGILAFSQGGAAAQRFIDKTTTSQIAFCIYVASPYVSECSHDKKQLSTFHIMGKSDTIIPITESSKLLEAYQFNNESPSFVTMEFIHDGGHYVPGTKPLRTLLLEFITKL